MINLDNLDLNIIVELRENGSTNKTKLASKFSVNEGTIRKRINKLINSGFLRIKGLINPSLIDNKIVIIVGIKVTLTKNLIDAAKEISNFPSVHSVMIVSGRYDIIIEMFIELSEYANFVTKQLSKIKFITSTESFISLNCIKKWI